MQSLHRGRDRECKTNSIHRAPSELVRNAPALTVSAQLQHCWSWNPDAAVSFCDPCEYFSNHQYVPTWRRQSAACGSIRQSSKFPRCSLLHFKSSVPGITRSRSRDSILRLLFQMCSILLTSRKATSLKSWLPSNLRSGFYSHHQMERKK